jgi:hypothetical protein
MVRRQKQNVSLVTVWSLDLLVFRPRRAVGLFSLHYFPSRKDGRIGCWCRCESKETIVKSKQKKKKTDDALIDLPASSSSPDSREFGLLIFSRSFPLLLLLLPTTPEKNTTLHSTRAGGGRGTQPLTGLTDSFFPLAAYNIVRVLSVHFLYVSKPPSSRRRRP